MRLFHYTHPCYKVDWRGGRAVERSSLENCSTFTGTEGSNPSLSARYLARFARVASAPDVKSGAAAANSKPALF